MPAETTISVQYNMIKSNFFRVVYADGAWGGVTPRGMIGFSFYNERQAIPKVTTVDLKSGDGVNFATVTEEKLIEGRTGVVRELEVEVLMDVNTAVMFHKWLGEKIAERQAGPKP